MDDPERDEDDDQEQGPDVERGLRGGAKRLSREELLEVERFSDIAALYVRAGVPVLRAWQAANEWIEEHAPAQLARQSCLRQLGFRLPRLFSDARKSLIHTLSTLERLALNHEWLLRSR